MYNYEKFLEVPYKNGGRDMNGLDCYGLILLIYKDLGIKLFDIDEEYDKDWSWKGSDYVKKYYHMNWKRIKDNIQFPDVIAMRNGKGILNHGGVYLGKKRFIHCTKAGVTVAKTSQKPWKKRIEAYYRYKGEHEC